MAVKSRLSWFSAGRGECSCRLLSWQPVDILHFETAWGCIPASFSLWRVLHKLRSQSPQAPERGSFVVSWRPSPAGLKQISFSPSPHPFMSGRLEDKEQGSGEALAFGACVARPAAPQAPTSGGFGPAFLSLNLRQ